MPIENTSATLIGKMKDCYDEEAWDRFVLYYKPYINNVVLAMNPIRNDVDDLVQRIILKIWKKVFSYLTTPAKEQCPSRWILSVTCIMVLSLRVD